MTLETLEKLITEYYSLDNFWSEENTKPRVKVKARRMFFLFAKEFLHKTPYDLAERYNCKAYTIFADLRILRGEIEVNKVVERQFNELKDAFNANHEPFQKSVDFEKGRLKGIKEAINTLNKLL